MADQSQLNSVGGVGGVGVGGDLLSGMMGAPALQGQSLAANRVMCGTSGQMDTTGGQMGTMTQMSEEMLEEMQEMMRVQVLMLEVAQLEALAKQQEQQGDQDGLAQTQAQLQKLMQELAKITGAGQNQGQSTSGVSPVDTSSSYGSTPSYSGSTPSYSGTSGSGSSGSGGTSSSLNAPVVSAGGSSANVSQYLDGSGTADIPKKYKDNQVAQLIWQEAKKAGADPYVMLATAIVESGLDPNAVGDNGTSFGLYQYHEGGALGDHDKEWAFNPMNIIQDEAKRFASAGAKSGADAAAVQRPADQEGYAKKVDALIAEMKQG